ncbi:hypothetical protein GCM10009087_31050 [Sphingomonas oligophenolica]|uniref:Transposase n=1 Tax=Sphingomonas oligophenolica TaxID=301154 RepID=A0ABU9Y6M3_9SPHN
MVYILDTQPTETLSLAEYVEYVENNVDPADIDSLEEHAWALRALANNRTFVLDEYHNELKACWSGVSVNENSPQSIVLARTRDFLIRSNIWVPVPESSVHTDFERSYFAYDLAHDHNFSFVSVGYFGPGYETDLFEYDYATVQGYEGEPVDLVECGRHQLKPGRVMVYRSGKDVHIQFPPDQVSVSLNLMCRSEDTRTAQQYIFDVQNKTISRGAGDIASTRLFLIDIFRTLHDDNTVDLLYQTVCHHRCTRTQAFALNVLGEIRPAELEKFLSSAKSDALKLSTLPLVYGSGGRDYSGA